MPTETWAPIKKSTVDIPSRYEVSTWGRVKNKQTGKYITPFLATNGQRNPTVSLNIDGRPCNFSLAKLVAEMFIGLPPQGTRLVFKDGDKLNCKKVNLEYRTYAANVPPQNKEKPVLSFHETARRIWSELIPETQRLLKKYDLLADAPKVHTHGEHGISSRYQAEVPKSDG